jgi:hypothetical protein
MADAASDSKPAEEIRDGPLTAHLIRQTHVNTTPEPPTDLLPGLRQPRPDQRPLLTLLPKREARDANHRTREVP